MQEEGRNTRKNNRTMTHDGEEQNQPITIETTNKNKEE